jgi:hypothetical protein
MDRGRFDELARFVSTNVMQSRRGVLATLLGAALLHQAPDEAEARRRRRKAKRRRRRSVSPPPRVTPRPLVPSSGSCFPGTNCSFPGAGVVAKGCDFSGSDTLRQKDLRGAVLSGANLTGAVLVGADLRGALLDGACLVGASLYTARLDTSTLLKGAILCGTVLPDGTVDDTGCGHGTTCCPTTSPPPGDTCQGLFHLCGIPGHCCDGLTCAPIVFNPLVTGCQKECKSDADCAPYGNNLACLPNALICPSAAVKCCTPV